MPVKPIADFNDRWLALRERIRASGGKGEGATPLRVVVVGGGAGGVEMALAMRSAIDKQRVRSRGTLMMQLLCLAPQCKWQ